MKNFDYNIPTEVFFGKGQIKNLGGAIRPYAKSVLMVYGGGSIKKTGLYDTILALLKQADLSVYELPGVEPNPRLDTVHRGVALCKEHQIEAVLGVGGGSSIDCAKAVALGALYDGDVWDFYAGKRKPEKTLPIFSVLTIAATGSEMDGISVVTNLQTRDKTALRHPVLTPRASILDPTYTYTVPTFQTASGTADIFAHLLESYFNRTPSADVPARIAAGLMKVCVKYGPIALREPSNYEARANLMWTSSLAINNLIKYGVDYEDFSWSCHPMEHPLSAFYDVTHGAGLAVLYPAWMGYVLSDKTVDKFAEYGIEVFELSRSLDRYELAQQAIQKTREFFTDGLGLPDSLGKLGIGEEHICEMAEKAANSMNGYVRLSKEDVAAIYRMCL